ncbi:MAG: ArsR family transcriptional regulator [Desulfobacca sp.]|nr:ArsR family transcriptional regulator [Desulfobacca sp.]
MVKTLSTLIDDKHSPIDQEAFANLCKALAHPARLKIINYLKQVNQCICGHIVDILPLSQSTVSQHLKILKEANLIWGEVDGPRTCYCLNLEMFEKFKKMAAEL